MSSKPAATSEQLLKKLRRLEYNMSCPNCGTKAPIGIGFGNVCVKFKTFVCDLCKTSHQAISHRVKSISMSTWTIDEVNELSDDHRGGNQAARHVWLGNAPPIGGKYPGGARPKEGDKVEVFKQFVLDCYEYGKFKSTTPYSPPSAAGGTRNDSRLPVTSDGLTSSSSSAASSTKSSTSLRKPQVAAVSAAVATAVDLLDFQESITSNPTPLAPFDAFGFRGPITAAGPAPFATISSLTPSPTEDLFADFSSAPSSVSNSTKTAGTTGTSVSLNNTPLPLLDPFAAPSSTFFPSGTGAVSPPAIFDPFLGSSSSQLQSASSLASSATATPQTSVHGFDPFGNMSSSLPLPGTQQQGGNLMSVQRSTPAGTMVDPFASATGGGNIPVTMMGNGLGAGTSTSYLHSMPPTQGGVPPPPPLPPHPSWSSTSLTATTTTSATLPQQPSFIGSQQQQQQQQATLSSSLVNTNGLVQNNVHIIAQQPISSTPNSGTMMGGIGMGGYNNKSPAAAISTMNQMTGGVFPNAAAPFGIPNSMRASTVMGMVPNGAPPSMLGGGGTSLGGMNMGVMQVGHTGLQLPVSGNILGSNMGVGMAVGAGPGFQQGIVPGGMMNPLGGGMPINGMGMSSGTMLHHPASVPYSQPMMSAAGPTGTSSIATPLRGFVTTNSGVASNLAGSNGSGKGWSTVSSAAASAPRDAFDFVGATIKSQLDGGGGR